MASVEFAKQRLARTQEIFESLQGDETQKVLYMIHNNSALRLTIADLKDFFNPEVLHVTGLYENWIIRKKVFVQAFHPQHTGIPYEHFSLPRVIVSQSSPN